MPRISECVPLCVNLFIQCQFLIFFFNVNTLCQITSSRHERIVNHMTSLISLFSLVGSIVTETE